MIEKLLKFIEQSPTSWHAAKNIVEELEEAGFIPCSEGPWDLKPCQGYYTTMEGSAVIAFRMPEKRPQRFLLTASHLDSPCFRIRQNAEMKGAYTRLSVERYGGGIYATWMDRPLSIAGRAWIRNENGLESKLLDFKEDAAVIPNAAIHLQPKINSDPNYDLNKDFFPLYSMSEEACSWHEQIAKELGVEEGDIVSTELILYNNQKGTVWGPDREFVSAPRLDDLSCVYPSLEGFLSSENEDSVTMFCAFDNEEIGSETLPGAASTFLTDVIREICFVLGASPSEKRKILGQSMMLSCDNGHALHPNRPELSDGMEAPVMNQGIAIKHSSRYTTTGKSAAIFQELCHRKEIPVQHYSNRPDKAGGATLGNIAMTKNGIMAVDIGIPQLAMHSAFETCGRLDIEGFRDAIDAFYDIKLLKTENGFIIK